MRLEVRFKAAVLLVAVCAAITHAQAPTQTRFFVLPDTGVTPGSDSMFSGVEGTSFYAFDFTEDLRFARGAYFSLVQDQTNPYAWNVVDFHIPGTDTTLGSQVTFGRPASPGPYGTWVSSDPTGFPNYATVTATITGEITATGPMSGIWTPSTTLTLTGTIVPGYYHNVILLTGSFGGIGGSISLYMKNDFYPPAVTWEMILHNSLSSADPGGGATSAQGGMTLQRGIATPNVYEVFNLHIEVGQSPAVVLTTPPAQSGGVLTFDPASRGLTGYLNVLIDGVPATLPLDGTGESFAGAVMHPAGFVIDEPLGAGVLTAVHFEFSSTELVPATPPINDFQIGASTQLKMRGRANHMFACAATFSAVPGVNTPVGDIPVSIDDLFWLSIDPTNLYFANMIGIMPAAGETYISISIPNDPALIGATFFLGGGTFDPATLAVYAATNSHRAIVK
jgi:hypothetical protein